MGSVKPPKTIRDVRKNLDRRERVSHPAHYGGADNPYECIKVLQAWLSRDQYIGFCLGNSLKYQSRWESKGGLEDLLKAAWYQNELRIGSILSIGYGKCRGTR